MAPDRGVPPRKTSTENVIASDSSPPSPYAVGGANILNEQSTSHERPQARSSSQDFTIRSIFVGLAIGIVICFSNTYFGLQTGWVSGMAMPASLIGFAYFKAVSRCLAAPFSSVENVLVQTVAGAVGTMPLGVGFVGVVPALEFLLKPEEGGPLNLSFGRLVAWAVGVCFFGVFVAVPLRREVLIKEKLKFPSGTATALMIGVLHGDKKAVEGEEIEEQQEWANEAEWERQELVEETVPEAETDERDNKGQWKTRIKHLIITFTVSAVYTLSSYFVPQLHHVPIFGLPLSNQWLWNLNPSPAYVGQGIIMGPATSIHMLLGALIGWGMLSPLAKNRGWASGPVDDWESGSKGWIVWISLAIMLADSLVNLGWLILRPALRYGLDYLIGLKEQYKRGQLHPWSLIRFASFKPGYARIDSHRSESNVLSLTKLSDGEDLETDAPPEHLISAKVTYIGLLFSIIICIAGVHIAFPGLIQIHITVLAILFSLLLSIMGVRALGETDLNPVSGISKLTQLVFAAILPDSPTAIPLNLIAGAISESAALQAGDMMQDLKTGQILGASPRAQFYGQLIGSLVGAIVSALVYRLYTSVYTIPSGIFQVPTGYVWIFTARLVTGQGLPPEAGRWAAGAGTIWVALTAIRIAGQGKKWQAFVPGGIAVAVGMYNVPSFTLARTAGGLLAWYWSWKGGQEETVVVLASGLILGEGVGSILNLAMASAQAPHL